jgi:hypothetical protein
MQTKYWSGNVNGKDHLGDLSINGRIILILKTNNNKNIVRIMCGLDSTGSG